MQCHIVDTLDLAKEWNNKFNTRCTHDTRVWEKRVYALSVAGMIFLKKLLDFFSLKFLIKINCMGVLGIILLVDMEGGLWIDLYIQWDWLLVIYWRQPWVRARGLFLLPLLVFGHHLTQTHARTVHAATVFVTLDVCQSCFV